MCAAVALISACGSTPIPPMAPLPPMSPIISAPAQATPLPKPPPEPTPPSAEVFSVNLAGVPEGDSGGGLTVRTVAPVAPITGEVDRTAGGHAPARVADETAQPSSAPFRISLILPLRSDTLGAAAAALRAGFMAGWERDRDNITVTVVETGDVNQDILASYALALERDDIIVCPLARSAVAAVAGSTLVTKPTIALNYPDGHGSAGAAPLPPKMLAMGLSIEEEARQVAQWAGSEHPGASAMVISTSSACQLVGRPPGHFQHPQRDNKRRDFPGHRNGAGNRTREGCTAHAQSDHGCAATLSAPCA